MGQGLWTCRFLSVKIHPTKQGINMERTLIIAKPDAVQRGLVGEIIRRLERKGLKLIGIKMMGLDSAVLKAHYAHLKDKPFYEDLEQFMKSSPVVVMAWEGYECINSVRIIVGATNPREADAGTIRGDFSQGTGRNLIHASDSKQSGTEEIARFFEDNELFSYDKTEYEHVYSKPERE
jgi:nucleoside-diphosphate kinase